MNEKSGIKCRRCGGFIPITEVKEWVSCPDCGNSLRLNWWFKELEPEDKEQRETKKDDD